ncbi:DUF2325 domain-containing protein [Paracidovorax sp. MALMAid1276]|uniref:DUF2325 domain-containing protein n=1 Tax=Paracidovorax sp. MALMAid1276 TaxID=3411631 RepID=UPI003B990734
MSSLLQEFMVLSRQLGEAQQRCSDAMAAQAAEIDTLRSELVRLRGALVVRGTELAMAREALAQAQAASPGLPRRKAMAGHIRTLAERITTLSRECLRWRLAAQQMPSHVGESAQARAQPQQPQQPSQPALSRPSALADAPASAAPAMPAMPVAWAAPLEFHALAHSAHDLDASLAAADLVICQTGCISHDDYWRVQDHCRRTGKTCILVDQPLAALRPMPVLRMPGPQHGGPADEVPEVSEVPEGVMILSKNRP